jgi:hypothetical protein
MAMDVGGSFYSYAGGIWDDEVGSDCLATGGSHAMVFVGYGTDVTSTGESVDYYLIQNSWGPKYGGLSNVKIIWLKITRSNHRKRLRQNQKRKRRQRIMR